MGFVKLQLVAKYQKKLKGDPLETLKKIRKKFKNEIFEQCHSAEKCDRRAPLGFFDIHCVAKFKKIEGGDPLVESKMLQKKSQSAEKNLSEKHQRGDPMLSRFWTSMFLFCTRFWRFEYVLEVRS